jgi:hypothetical protein
VPPPRRSAAAGVFVRGAEAELAAAPGSYDAKLGPPLLSIEPA